MIITSIEKLELNKIYTEIDLKRPFEYLGIKHNKYKFLVIRECTLEEYRNYLNETFEKDLVNQILNYEYFYEISMD